MTKVESGGKAVEGKYPFEVAWQEYLVAEQTCVKTAWRAALERFLVAFNEAKMDERARWSVQVVDESTKTPGQVPMRRPLVERGLLPALLPGAIRREPGPSKAVVGILLENMGQVSGHTLGNLHVPGLKEFTERFKETYHMILYALECNPKDPVVRGWAIKWLRNSLWFLLHELPAGLLYDNTRGASPAECIDMELGEVALLERLVKEDGSFEAHREIIEKARFHCRHYRAYLLEEPRAENYATYLQTNPEPRD